jgi:hypothetical protein
MDKKIRRVWILYPNCFASHCFKLLYGDWHYIFFLIRLNPNNNFMDLFIIILSFILAYGIFVLIAVKLAKVFFPKIQDDEVELKTGTMRQRHPKRFSI